MVAVAAAVDLHLVVHLTQPRAAAAKVLVNQAQHGVTQQLAAQALVAVEELDFYQAVARTVQVEALAKLLCLYLLQTTRAMLPEQVYRHHQQHQVRQY
jgi:hypothetical protein